MNRILSKVKLAEEVYRMEIHAPLIASERKPGSL